MDESHLIAPTVHGNTADLPTAFTQPRFPVLMTWFELSLLSDATSWAFACLWRCAQNTAMD